MHFGGILVSCLVKAYNTATFLKNVFAHTLHDLEISTIERKCLNTETNCTILLERNSS